MDMAIQVTLPSVEASYIEPRFNNLPVSFEQAITGVIERGTAPGAPKRLSNAIRAAVLGGGSRMRPRLCLAVSDACGNNDPETAIAAAVSIELLHCASLVHDDLPAFDNALTRRGMPAIHVAFSEPLAILTGDAVIALAFKALCMLATPNRIPVLLEIISDSIAPPHGIIAGQGWESETLVDLAAYHRSKTGAMFAAATMAGAAAAGADSSAWRHIGEMIGDAYQIADDIYDAVAEPGVLSKPVGRDQALKRPNAVALLGLDGAKNSFKGIVARLQDELPACANRDTIQNFVRQECLRIQRMLN